MKRILIYGFEKFDKLESNSSAIVAKSVYGFLKKKTEVSFKILPSTFEAWEILKEKIASFNPDIIIGFGLANRPRICIEALALNIIDSPKPDNKSKILRHTKIDKDSGIAIEATLDVLDLYSHFKKKNIPVTVSYFPDTYVCNSLYFNCLNYIKKHNLDIKTVFLHLPINPEEVNRLDLNAASFPTPLIADAVNDYILRLNYKQNDR